MTRINVVPVTELCDQHLLAEHRELTRIPNCIARGRYNMKGQPAEYTLGTGHVKFFYDKLAWLSTRYGKLGIECRERGFKVTNRWPHDISLDSSMWGSYTPTPEALTINRERIAERMAAFNPRWTT